MATWRKGVDEEFQASSSLPLWREALLGIDWLALRMSPVYRGVGVPPGDGSAVVVIPGFMGSDQYLADMHAWLRRIGYRPYMSGIGRNSECPEILSMRLLETLERAYLETGRKVHLIGHSLGGVLARGAGVRWPHLVASVTTMGSPFRGVRVHPFVLQTAYLVRGRILQRQNGPSVLPTCYSGLCTCQFLESIRARFPSSVPSLAIYTKTDGVVDWRCCVGEDPETSVEVPGTHVGLAFNPQVYRNIGTFLAAPRRSSREEVA
jgi:pimeloyl-ACP methyl ester carboxylesterase